MTKFKLSDKISFKSSHSQEGVRTEMAFILSKLKTMSADQIRAIADRIERMTE